MRVAHGQGQAADWMASEGGFTTGNGGLGDTGVRGLLSPLLRRASLTYWSGLVRGRGPPRVGCSASVRDMEQNRTQESWRGIRATSNM